MSDDSPTQSTTVDVHGARGIGVNITGARLAVVHPPELRRRIELPRGVTILGRNPDQSLGRLQHGTVSRSHARLRWDAKAYTHFASDLGSHNGSRLDGRPLETESQLRDGAVLRLGSVLAVYEVLKEDPRDAEALREHIVGGSPAISRLRCDLARSAPDPSPVLVTGDTGAGKEHVASALHELSGRTGPLIAVNVSELPAQLIESQLFGHAKGAYTGAGAARAGLFREANGGTLFLDEIGELPLDLQPKLLRVIQEQTVRAVGATATEKVDVRIVAATNRDLGSEVERGAFRQDLLARLSLLELRVPSLADRRGDILEWIQVLHRRWCETRGRPCEPLRFDSAAGEALLLMDWPLNLRGLDRLVHRLALRGDCSADTPPATVDQLEEAIGQRADPPPRKTGAPAANPQPAPPPPNTAEDAPKIAPLKRPAPTTAEEFAEVFARFDGRVRAVAKWYGRDRRQVYRWMKAFGLERSENGK